MSRWLPDILRGDRGRPGIASFADLNAYLSSVWSPANYYLDAVNGSDANDGTSWATAFKTSDVLTDRVCLTRPIGHAMTVHVAPGSYGALRADVTQTAIGIPFDVIGYPVYSVVGNVLTCVTKDVATNTAPQFSINGIADLSAWVGRRLDVASAGASFGSSSWAAKVNPHGAGVSVCRCPTFATAGTASFTPVANLPLVGVSVVSPVLPSFDSIDLRISSPLPDPATDYLINRSGKVSELDITALTVLSAGRFLVDRCSLGYPNFLGRPAYTAPAVTRCLIRGIGANIYLAHGYFYNSLFGAPGRPLVTVSLGSNAQLSECLLQGVNASFRPSADAGSVLNCGAFDKASTPPFATSKFAGGAVAISGCYGRDNSVAGINLAKGTTIMFTSPNTIVGTSGAVRLEDQAAFLLTHDQWLDGAQSGLATLVNGTTVVAGVSTIVVPRVLATQRLQVARKTPLGTTGDLSINWVDDTHIRVDSQSLLDQSIVTWSILPVGSASNYIKAY